MTYETVVTASSGALAALAKQLRDGPLQDLMELHRSATLQSCDVASREGQLQQLTELALVSLAAMEHFHALTRELRAQIAALTDTARLDLH